MKKTLLNIDDLPPEYRRSLLGARREERAGDRTFGHIHSRERLYFISL